jgi:hypothetical protein
MTILITCDLEFTTTPNYSINTKDVYKYSSDNLIRLQEHMLHLSFTRSLIVKTLIYRGYFSNP